MEVDKAIQVLRDELLKHEDLYRGFHESIRSAIAEAPNYTRGDKLAELILKRIIGED